MKQLLLIIISLSLFGCITDQKSIYIKKNSLHNFPHIIFDEKDYGNVLGSPVSGEIIDFRVDNNLTSITIDTSKMFYADHLTHKASFYIVLGNILDYSHEFKTVSLGDVIGKVTKETYITYKTDDFDGFLLDNAITRSMDDGVWWFIPNWLTSKKVKEMVTP